MGYPHASPAGPQVIFPAVLAGCNEVDAEQCCTADAASITTLVDCNGTCPHSCPASAPSPASSEPPAVIDVGRTGVGSQAVLDEWREAGLVQTAGTLGLLTRCVPLALPPWGGGALTDASRAALAAPLCARRPSLYLTPAAWDMVSSSDHSSDAAVAALRHRDVIKMLHQPLENATISALAQGNCEDGRRPWEAGCRNGWYHAPPCDPREGGDPAYCFTILAGYPADAAGAPLPRWARARAPRVTRRVPSPPLRPAAPACHQPGPERLRGVAGRCIPGHGGAAPGPWGRRCDLGVDPLPGAWVPGPRPHCCASLGH